MAENDKNQQPIQIDFNDEDDLAMLSLLAQLESSAQNPQPNEKTDQEEDSNAVDIYTLMYQQKFFIFYNRKIVFKNFLDLKSITNKITCEANAISRNVCEQKKEYHHLQLVISDKFKCEIYNLFDVNEQLNTHCIPTGIYKYAFVHHTIKKESLFSLYPLWHVLDQHLNGGIMTRQVTEITGCANSGKTCLCYQIMLYAILFEVLIARQQQNPQPVDDTNKSNDPSTSNEKAETDQIDSNQIHEAIQKEVSRFYNVIFIDCSNELNMTRFEYFIDVFINKFNLVADFNDHNSESIHRQTYKKIF
ncbi:hypothetical protein RFI_08875 [Reticulomyxa filosa]|uniref:Uncharacterized protein n=1 Tax=Reticulomyxa filosa TaxID=46433 RepID=X6NSE7_RETFI|nr:hypothetical protein RFI_08875 [Reticulomyxa filosa]|eukprot:ETO28257.1 hypothetical protein RFI_08875 [Reticulomyxa filosa]